MKLPFAIAASSILVWSGTAEVTGPQPDANIISAQYLCKSIRDGTFNETNFANLMQTGHYRIDDPDFVCISDKTELDYDNDQSRLLLEARELGTTYRGEGGECDNTYKRWYWKNWYTYTYETMYNVCSSGLKCVWNQCRQPISTTSFSKTVAGSRFELADWIYSDQGGSRTTGVPTGYTRLYGNERHAVLKVNAEPGKCVLVHRATFDFDEIVTDLQSQFMACKDVHGKCVNPAFWDSYQHIVSQGQTTHIQQAISNHGCQTFELVGHSLGGATINMALIDLGHGVLSGKIGDVYVAGLPRSVYSGYSWALLKDFSNTCSSMKSLINGKIYRFARIKRTNKSDGDPVPAIPLDWHHCSDKDTAVISNDIAGSNPILMEGIGMDTPNDSVTALDDAIQWVWGLVTSPNSNSWHSIVVYESIVKNGVVVRQ